MFSFFKYFGISEKNDIFDFTSWHQFSESQPGLKSTIFIPPACRIYWVQKSCNTTNFLHNSSLSKKAQLQENCINLIIWRLTKVECPPTWSSMVGEKNWHFDHVPYLGIPKYFRFWLYKDRSSSIYKVWFGQMNKQSSKKLFKSYRKMEVTPVVECVTKHYYCIYNKLNIFS